LEGAGMSDNWIVLIPEDPRFVPSAKLRTRARDRLVEIAPEAEGIEIKVSKTVEFFDCGGNFERIRCPSCRKKIPTDWWQERMNEDFRKGSGFKLAAYATPCCRKKRTLHELVYQWPQGFGRFALDAMNPNIGKLKAKFRRELEEILGTELRVIYQHI
jgi:hypothetical protein